MVMAADDGRKSNEKKNGGGAQQGVQDEYTGCLFLLFDQLSGF